MFGMKRTLSSIDEFLFFEEVGPTPVLGFARSRVALALNTTKHVHISLVRFLNIKKPAVFEESVQFSSATQRHMRFHDLEAHL